MSCLLGEDHHGFGATRVAIVAGRHLHLSTARERLIMAAWAQVPEVTAAAAR